MTLAGKIIFQDRVTDMLQMSLSACVSVIANCSGRTAHTVSFAKY